MRNLKKIVNNTKLFYYNNIKYYGTTVNQVQNSFNEIINAKSYDEVPGPKPLPIVGNLFRFLPGFHRQYDFTDLIGVHKILHEEFGEISKFSGLKFRNDILFVYRAEDIETVYRNDGIWPIRPPLLSLEYYRKKIRKDFFEGTGGVLVEQGQKWHDARTHANPILMQTKVVQTYTSRINEVAEDFLKIFPDFIGNDKKLPNDFANELHKWALESIAVIALDTRLGCLNKNLSTNSEPQLMINAVHDALKSLHILEIVEFWWHFRPSSSKSLKKLTHTLDFFIEVSMKHINNAIKRIDAQKGQDHDRSVLELSLERDPNPKRAVIMALDMLLAGVDTTTHALTNVLLMLCENPDKQEVLFNELKSLLPTADTPITSEILNEMKYLKACTRETFRLRPVVTANIRTSSTEMVLSNYKIPKGVDILLPNAYMSRMEKYFPETDKFVPERWLRNSDKNPFPDFKNNPFVSLPFGHGARKCIGMRFANLEMEVLLAKLIRNYHWEWNNPKMNYASELILRPADPLTFTVKLR